MAQKNRTGRKFTPQRRNANRHTLAGLRELEKSIQRDGWLGAQTAAADGEIFDGSARLEVAADKFDGVAPLVVESDGTRPIVVVRTDIPNADDPRAKRLAVAANQIAALDLDFDHDILLSLMEEDAAIKELVAQDAALMEKLTQGVLGGPEETADVGELIDRAAELQKKWKVQRGDVWEIGRHKLMCGDSTSAEDVAKLMGGEKAAMVKADPPYNVGYTGGSTNANARADSYKDKKTDFEYTGWLLSILANAYSVSDEKAALHLWFAATKMRSILDAIEGAGWEVRNLIIWNKLKAHYGALGAQYKERKEPMWYAFKKGNSPRWFGESNECTVWDVEQPHVNDLHPTMKPISLYTRSISNHTQVGDIVIEMFNGSGTTLVACEQTGRSGRGMEIEPKYCSVSLERLSLLGLECKRAPH